MTHQREIWISQKKCWVLRTSLANFPNFLENFSGFNLDEGDNGGDSGHFVCATWQLMKYATNNRSGSTQVERWGPDISVVFRNSIFLAALWFMTIRLESSQRPFLPLFSQHLKKLPKSETILKTFQAIINWYHKFMMSIVRGISWNVGSTFLPTASSVFFWGSPTALHRQGKKLHGIFRHIQSTHQPWRLAQGGVAFQMW